MDREIVDGRRLVVRRFACQSFDREMNIYFFFEVNFAKPKQKVVCSSKDHATTSFNHFKSNWWISEHWLLQRLFNDDAFIEGNRTIDQLVTRTILIRVWASQRRQQLVDKIWPASRHSRRRQLVRLRRIKPIETTFEGNASTLLCRFGRLVFFSGQSACVQLFIDRTNIVRSEDRTISETFSI